jgi:phytol kinase
MTSLILIAIPVGLLMFVMGVLSQIDSSHLIARELKRKALHISIGLAAISFPLFLREPWMITAAVALVIVWLTLVRQVPFLRRHFGTVLHDVKRESLGEIYFAISIGALLLLTQNEPILFVIPILILALADASAAIVGKAFPIGLLAGMAKGKTAAGCITFFIVAFIISSWTLTTFTDLPTTHILLLAVGLATTTCFAEAISRRGIDNLIVPGMAYLTLIGSGMPRTAGNATMVQIQLQLQLELNALISGSLI